jgi:hypothetical protein
MSSDPFDDYWMPKEAALLQAGFPELFVRGLGELEWTTWCQRAKIAAQDTKERTATANNMPRVEICALHVANAECAWGNEGVSCGMRACVYSDERKLSPVG